MKIRGRKPSLPCSLSLSSPSPSPPPSPSSSLSSYSSSITAANSSASSQDSSNSCLNPPSQRWPGLDLLVKAIHQVTAGSVIGVPYIQRRVIIRRRRRRGLDSDAFLFDGMSQRTSLKRVGDSELKKKKKKKKTMKQKVKKESGLPDSVLQSRVGRSDLAASIEAESSSSSSDENEELQRLEHAPPFWRNKSPKKRLSKQLSMCELPRDIAWERRRRQFVRQERKKNGINKESDDLTDEDLHELKGCIELGFGFNEENGQRLCTTLPALDLYFAVNRQLVTSPLSSPASNTSAPSIASTPSGPGSGGLGARSSSFCSDSDSWKICSPGDDPQHVKTKLRHWALAVACSVKQSS